MSAPVRPAYAAVTAILVMLTYAVGGTPARSAAATPVAVTTPAAATPAAATGASATATATATAQPGRIVAAHPPSPPALAAIEPMAQYVPQTSCDPAFKTGTAELGNLLTGEYAGTTYQGAYACGTDGSTSEHYEGRALDWMVSVHDATQHADARAVVKWLFATDKYGNEFARARRLGVMYIVWNNRIWGSWDGRWAAYGSCADTPQPSYDNSCHRTHMHISLSWEGALAETSFWTGVPAASDYGPCVRDGLNWAANRKRARNHPCPSHTGLTAPRTAGSAYRALVPYAGARVSYLYTGPVVSAVQLALGISRTGRFGKKTRRTVEAFQLAHGVSATGKTNIATWRALLAATAPH